jgi:hypothetical protein
MTAGQPRLFPTPQEQVTSDDYYTPPWIFERMALEFDIDVCAPPDGIAWIPAARYFTQADDGLVQPWEGRVWMNPPYRHTLPTDGYARASQPSTSTRRGVRRGHRSSRRCSKDRLMGEAKPVERLSRE